MTCSKEWFGGNENAVKLYNDLCGISHLWDDLIDQDKPIDRQQVSEAFKIMLADLPMNPLWRENYVEVYPIIASSIAAYECANIMEKSNDDHQIEIAHGLRYALGNLFTYMSMNMIGYKKALGYMPDMWKEMMPERFNDYLKEHKK